MNRFPIKPPMVSAVQHAVHHDLIVNLRENT
jgi:hypothetical protein